MRFYEFDDGLTNLTLLLEDGEIVIMKKVGGRFVHLDDNTPYGGKVYYFKKHASSFSPVDASVFDEYKRKKSSNWRSY